MKRDADFFTDDDLHLVYIARRLAEALELEGALTERSIDYLVEPDTYTGGVIFRRARVGAFFYVRADDRERAAAVMKASGYHPYEPDGEAAG
jgi:hypothetical protein